MKKKTPQSTKQVKIMIKNKNHNKIKKTNKKLLKK